MKKGEVWECSIPRNFVGTGVKREFFVVVTDEFSTGWRATSDAALTEVYLLDSNSEVVWIFVETTKGQGWRLVS